MLKNPRHGWCDLKISGVSIPVSCTTDAPLDLLDAFSEYLGNVARMGWSRPATVEFDREEEGEAVLVIRHLESYIIYDDPDSGSVSVTVIHRSVHELAEELANDIEDPGVSAWVKYFLASADPEEDEVLEKLIKKKLRRLKNLLRNYTGCGRGYVR